MLNLSLAGCLGLASLPVVVTQPAHAGERAIAATTQQHHASELRDAVLRAYGGAAKIKEMQERAQRCHGTFNIISSITNAPNTFECDLLRKGNKYRTEMTLLGQPMIMAFDGHRTWTQFGDWVAPGADTHSLRKSDEIKHGLLCLGELDDPHAKLELLPNAKAAGRECRVLRLTLADGQPTSIYIDPTTHLVMRTEYSGFDDELGLPAVLANEYFDYKPVAGCPQPHRWVESANGKKTAEVILKSIDPDVVIEETAFQMPPESEIASLKNGPITIPFEYAGNEILIKARINNGPEIPFIVDAGATQSVIDKQTATALGPYSSHTITVTTGSKAMALSYTQLASLQIGELTLNNIPVFVTDLTSFSEAIGSRPAGLIGANILRRFAVTIDYQDRKLVLADPRSVTPPTNAILVPTKPVFGATQVIVSATLDGSTKMNCLVDTGASFNNVPPALAAKIYKGPLLPVGQMHGLDGQKIDTASIKIKSLKLGSVTLHNPVFATSLPAAGKDTGSGILSTDAMGILGNPTWSQFTTTIDYRNERLIIELPPDREAMEKIEGEIENVDRQYLVSQDTDAAIHAYEKLLTQAQVDRLKSAEALIVSHIAGCYADKFPKTKEARWLEIAGREFERAARLATEARNRSVEGQVLAQWALMHLNTPRSQNDINTALSLLNRALSRAPMEASIYAALGSATLNNKKFTQAQKLIDRALMLDPANWQALWARYRLAQDQNDERTRDLVAAQLQYYWSDVPEVLSILSQSGTESGKEPKKAPPLPGTIQLKPPQAPTKGK